MRIVHFLLGRCDPDSANGVDKTVYYLSKHQAALGHDVAVFSVTSKPPLWIPGVMVKTYPPKKVPFLLHDNLLHDLLEWKPDVVHLHSVYISQNAVLAMWLRKHKIPYVVTPNGGLSPYVTRRRWYLKVPYKYLFELPMLNGALFVHAVADKEDIQAYGVKSPIVEAPNCIDLDQIPNSVNKEILVKHVPEAKGKRVFLFLGRLDPLHKGLDLLLQAFAQCKLSNAVLILFGPDWKGNKAYLQNLVKTLNLEGSVFFPGPIYGEEKWHILGAADVFIHTSRWEGLPFGVLEALAMGRPCLLTRAADPMGKVAEYKAGIVVEPTVEAIAEGLKSFGDMSQEELTKMGSQARRLVEEEFNWEKTVRIIVEAYARYGQG